MFEIFIVVVFLFILLSVVIYTLKLGISPMFSSSTVTNYISSEIDLFRKDTIVDLGSGWGSFALIVATRYPSKKVIGYELSPVPYYFSKLLVLIFRVKNLTFVKKDIFSIEFDSESLYYTYLFPDGMKKLEESINSSKIKPLVLSSTFALPKKKAYYKKVLDDMFKTPIYFYKG